VTPKGGLLHEVKAVFGLRLLVARFLAVGVRDERVAEKNFGLLVVLDERSA
jgi:hypothetical protein